MRQRNKTALQWAVVISAYLLLGPLIFFTVTTCILRTPAGAHPIDGKKNAAGEWCCGEGDCFEIPPDQVTLQGNRYVIMRGGIASADPLEVLETIPESETLPAPDGKFWRCKRPDGSRRCFFAPPLGS